ncbi:ABC transporter permease [Actinomadura verrucosospora]|uniref:ABC transporter, permease component n=1 Tax=Actinomadura verrucosospora TaxID=46165 RepID=A0A7D4AX85_ACTVE|nr:ABC transporter permease subunit [Actinomadura verrucosospora]QKG27069.1 ABC transporter, permease component [Actinomadura verrucosospora]
MKLAVTCNTSWEEPPTSRQQSPAAALRRWRPAHSIGPKARAASRGVIGLAALAALVQTLSWWGPRKWGVPALGRLASEVGDLASAQGFLTAVLATVVAVALAVASGLVAAIVIGLAFGTSRLAHRAFGLPFEILRPVPAVAFIPLAILALGQGPTMEVVVGAFGCWWPMLFNTIYGVGQVDAQARDAARVLGCGRLALVTRVVLPSMLPFLLAGLRTAAPLALIVVIGAEYLASAGHGLGGVLIQATSTGDIDVLWATAVLTGVLGIAIGAVVALAGRLACPWATERAR